MPEHPAVRIAVSADLQARLPPGTQIIAADGRVEMSHGGSTKWQQRYFFLEALPDENLFSYQTWGGGSIAMVIQSKQICGIPIDLFNGHVCVVFYMFTPSTGSKDFIPEIFAAYSRTNGEWMIEHNPAAVSAMFRQSKAAPGLGSILFKQFTGQKEKSYEGESGVELLRDIVKELKQRLSGSRKSGSSPRL